MNVLIAYDGSEYANAALADLRRAGLHDVDARVLTVGEVWLPPEEQVPEAAATASIREALSAHREHAVRNARSIAEHGLNWLREFYPHWRASAIGIAGSPVQQIVEHAMTWPADLVVLGAHGHSVAPRAFPGSIPMGVLRHVPCSVRIARAPDHPENINRRVILAVDGSAASHAMLSHVRARGWSPGTQFRVLSVVDTRLLPLSITGMPVGPTCEEWARRLVDDAAGLLHDAGLNAFGEIERGDPKRVILRAAQTWEADAIFLSARGISASPWLQLGSVAAAVAMRAHCSVEVVRFTGRGNAE